MLIFEDKIAVTTAKSIAVSSILIPPVMFMKTSFTPILKPAFFSRIAKSIFNLLELKPLEILCGVPYTALLTRA